MEAGSRRGRPRGGGTVGVTGTREKSLQSVNRYRVGFITDLENKKFLESLKYLVGTSVEWR